MNLSGFETFFSERRPFFVEGAGMFAFDLDCNDGAAAASSTRGGSGARRAARRCCVDGMYARVPQQTKILGAAKLTGRAGKFSFGAMNATTADEAGGRRQRRAAHATSRSSRSRTSRCVRARREFDNQSALGFIGTATVRKLTRSPTFLPGQAFTGGLDWDLRMKKRYAVHRLRGRQLGPRQRERDPAPAGEHGPQLPASRRGSRRGGPDAHVARRRRRSGGVPEDRRVEGPLQLQHRLQDARARHQRRRLHAPRRHCGR